MARLSYLVVTTTALFLPGCELLVDFDPDALPTCSPGPPRISIKNPPGGAVLPAVTLVSGTAKDCLKVTGVQVALGTSGWVEASGTTSWHAYLDLRQVAAGEHVLRVRSSNTRGEQDEASRRIQVIQFTPVKAAFPKVTTLHPWAADVDGDKHLDLGYDGGVLWGDGKGGFAKSRPGYTSLNCGELPVDVNDDGKLDLVCRGTGAHGGDLQIWLQETAGTFKERRITGTKTACYSGLAAGDMNGDGDVDLLLTSVYGEQCTSAADFFENDGKGEFIPVDSNKWGVSAGKTPYLWPVGATFGDLDDDGDLDLVVGGMYSTPAVVYQNMAGKRFEAVTSLPLLGKTTLLDHDLDGHLDVVFTGEGGQPGLFRGLGKLQFQEAGTITEYHGGPFADLNGDGWPEPLGTVLGLDSKGPRYGDAWIKIGGQPLSVLFAADVNGDRSLDLLSTKLDHAWLSSLITKTGSGEPTYLVVRLRRTSGGNRLGLGARVELYDQGHLGQRAHLRGLQVVGHAYQTVFHVNPSKRHDVGIRVPGQKPISCRNCKGGILEIRGPLCTCK